MRLTPALIAVTTFFLATAQTQEPSKAFSSVELPPTLQRVLTDYEVAWKAKDADGLAKLFAEDGFVLPSGNLPVRGRENIKRFYTGSGGGLSLRALAYATEGPVGYIIGGYAGVKGQPDTGKFTLTLKKVRDRWLIMSDMDNGNAPRRQ